MSITKAIHNLIKQIYESDNPIEKLNIFLNSYDINRDKKLEEIESFTNSIYTPTTKIEEKSIEEKANSYPKLRAALLYEKIIIKEFLSGKSDEKIANLLNKSYVHKEGYFNRKYINRFRKERGIV